MVNELDIFVSFVTVLRAVVTPLYVKVAGKLSGLRPHI